ncbi:MAG: hypothetical protein ACPIA2_16420, partial [Mariniblastus sp.]
MAQISPKACLLLLLLIFQYVGATETACADQSNAAVSAAILLGRSDPNSTRPAQLADQALNSNRILSASNRGSNDLHGSTNPLRTISPPRPRPNNERPLIQKNDAEQPLAQLLSKVLRQSKQRFQHSNQQIQMALEPIERLIQGKFEETVSDFCRQQIIPQLSSLNTQLRSTFSDRLNQPTPPATETLPPVRLSTSSTNPAPSAKLNNVQLVFLPAEAGDNYWQYYQDCDRWGVTFSELEVATRKANEMKIASQSIATKAHSISYRKLKKVESQEQPAVQGNNLLKEHLFKRSNDFIVALEEFADLTTVLISRLRTKTDHLMAVLEFQAVESHLTEYRLIRSKNRSKIRIANQFDILAIGVGCISRAIKQT